MSDRDKGSTQHADSNSKRRDKGAVEKTVVATGQVGSIFRSPVVRAA